MQQDRRHFLWLVSCASGALALSQTTGCSVNPISGERELIIISEEQELVIDKERTPHQFSQDMGIVQDAKLNQYVSDVGLAVASNSPRYNLPFNFQVVNSSYINAYAFPAGSIAVTRGILLELQSEDELAALVGHEIGHVNGRHQAQQISTSMITEYATFGLGAFFASKSEKLERPELFISDVATGALLTRYSSEREIEADAYGMEYCNKTDYNPQGIVSMMGSLRYLANHKPHAIALMLATHPMNDARFNRAQRSAQNIYHASLTRKLKVEKYKDTIASLRAIAPSIEAQQQGEARFAEKDIVGAIASYGEALTHTPDDYAALTGASRLYLIAGDNAKGQAYANEAIRVYPEEAQGYNLLAVAHLETQSPQKALDTLADYDALLPGNPSTDFLRGVSYDEMGDTDNAIESFEKFLESSPRGQQADYALARLEVYEE